jgi:anti-sigma28 factor (negative regulator of flagellin synthesis)
MMHVERIMERVQRDEYAVDPEKVADAILRRLLVGEGVDVHQCS